VTDKYPYMQFFVNDWLSDPLLSRCKPATRGIWLDLLCHMHNLDRSGVVSGSLQDLARLTRSSAGEFRGALSDLQSQDAADVTVRDGIITLVNRRMNREYRSRKSNQTRQNRYRSRQRGEDVTLEVTPPLRDISQKPELEPDPYGGGKPPVLGGEEFWVWREGVALLTRTGTKPQHARSFLGKLVKQYGKGTVAAAVLETQAAGAVDPRSYLVGVLKQNGQRRESAGERNERNIDETFRYLGAKGTAPGPDSAEISAGLLAAGADEEGT
jgi:hypothetical protein